MTIPSAERQEAFLQTTPNAVVATIRRSGLPQVTPNWFLWTGTEFWISVAAGCAKQRNIERDPRVVLCIDDAPSGDYVQVIGSATIVEGDAVRDPTIELIRKYREPADVLPHWDEISAASARVLIIVQPDRFLWHDR